MELRLIIHHPFSDWCAQEYADSIFVFFLFVNVEHGFVRALSHLQIWGALQNRATMLETKSLTSLFPVQDSLFITRCISDGGRRRSTPRLVILQSFRVNMSLQVRRMIASAWSAWSVNPLAAITHPTLCTQSRFCAYTTVKTPVPVFSPGAGLVPLILHHLKA